MQEHKYRAYIEEYDEVLPVLFIDFMNNAFCVMPIAELEGRNQIEIKDRMNLLDQFTGIIQEQKNFQMVKIFIKMIL